MNHVQTFLRDNAPEHPLRAFGAAVESSEASESLELKRKREKTEMAELDSRLKKIAADQRCLVWQEKEAEARAVAALEEQYRANEARRIANLREWIQLSGSDGVVQMKAADRVAANGMLRTVALRGSGSPPTISTSP